MQSTTPLPPLYARWLEQSLGHALPSENRATCDDCSMCGAAAERDGTTPDLQYNPKTKCCTFYPDLPNYLVGALLTDDTPGLTAKPIVARFIRDRIGVTPIGIFASPSFVDLYEINKSRGAEASHFGREEGLLCPYFNAAGGGLCGLWLHRNAVCSTWFCKHRDGALGRRFWDAVAALLKQVEQTMAAWCVEELISDQRVLEEIFDNAGMVRVVGQRKLRGRVDDQGQLEEGLSQRIWGPWHNREVEFYERCKDLVTNLDWKTIIEKAGPQVRHLERRMKELEPARHNNSPVLCKGQFATIKLEGNRLRILGREASNEPLELPKPIVDSLKAFDGRPTADVVQNLAADGLTIDDKLLGDLKRRGILVPPDGQDVPPISRPTAPLSPEDELRLFRGYRGAEPKVVEGKSAQGNPTLSLSCGQRGLTVQDATGFRFIRQLVRHGNGFRAGEVTNWLDMPPESWEQVRPMLEGFLASELLQRVASKP